MTLFVSILIGAGIALAFAYIIWFFNKKEDRGNPAAAQTAAGTQTQPTAPIVGGGTRWYYPGNLLWTALWASGMILVVFAIITVAVNYEFIKDWLVPTPADPSTSPIVAEPAHPVLPWDSPYLTGFGEKFGVGHGLVVLSAVIAGFAVIWLLFLALKSLFGATVGLRGRMVLSTNLVVALIAVAIIYVLIAQVYPQSTKAALAIVPLWAIILGTVAVLLVLGMMDNGPARFALVVLLLLIAGTILWRLPDCAPDDTACKQAVQEAKDRKDTAERKAQEDRVARFHEQRRRESPPPDKQCPDEWKSIEVGQKPVRFNPGAACRSQLKHAGHCYEGRRAAHTNDKKVYGPYCDRGPHVNTRVVDDLEEIWSADGRTFSASVRLFPDMSKHNRSRPSVASGLSRALFGN